MRVKPPGGVAGQGHRGNPKVLLVCDNLNTHKLGSLYETFPPKVVRQFAGRLEIHYSPKHGSWLNVAEIELSALAKQCLDRRIPVRNILSREVERWAEDRNHSQTGID